MDRSVANAGGIKIPLREGSAGCRNLVGQVGVRFNIENFKP
jgi:hypothetical protein